MAQINGTTSNATTNASTNKAYDFENHPVLKQFPDQDLTIQEIEGFEQFKVLTGSEDPTCVTFQFVNETHTLGNILRWFIMKNPSVDYCGYSLPHPLENKMNLRIQTSKDTTALEALKLAFQQLEQASDHLLETFAKEIQAGNYEVLEDEDALVRKNVSEALKNANKMEE